MNSQTKKESTVQEVRLSSGQFIRLVRNIGIKIKTISKKSVVLFVEQGAVNTVQQFKDNPNLGARMISTTGLVNEKIIPNGMTTTVRDFYEMDRMLQWDYSIGHSAYGGPSTLREAVKSGNKISAIKIMRDCYHTGLKQSKDYVESRWDVWRRILKVP